MLHDFVFALPGGGTARFDDFGVRAPFPLFARRELYREGATTGEHLHADFYALYLVGGGRGAHCINAHPYAMTRGDVYIMPPKATHAYRDYKNLEIHAFYFQPQVFSPDEQNALRALGGFRELFVTFFDEQPDGVAALRRDHRLHLTPERFAQAERVIEEIREEIAGENEGALLARGQFFRLLVWLSRWRGELDSRDHNARATGHDAALADVLRVCEERFAQPLSVPQLAALMFLSPGHFSELFHRETGMPPAAYLRRLRLERARTLLRDSNLSTSKIAQQTGFETSARLSRAFRAQLNTTPTAYRANFKK